MVYLIHFDAPLAHARHYIGFTEATTLSKRMKSHMLGTGSRLMRAVSIAGIPWAPVRIWKDGDRNFERSLKNKKNASLICPICNKKVKQYRYRGRKRKLVKAKPGAVLDREFAKVVNC